MFPKSYFSKSYFNSYYGKVISVITKWFISLRSIARYGMAETLNIEILQGDTFEWEITVNTIAGIPMDLTGYTARGMGRKKYTDLLPAFTFVCSPAADQVTDIGKLYVTLEATITSAIAVYLEYKYDIELVHTASGKVKKLYRGLALVKAEATK
jgi:hypothetical protein